MKYTVSSYSPASVVEEMATLNKTVVDSPDSGALFEDKELVVISMEPTLFPDKSYLASIVAVPELPWAPYPSVPGDKTVDALSIKFADPSYYYWTVTRVHTTIPKPMNNGTAAYRDLTV